jgi:hypothetical protein
MRKTIGLFAFIAALGAAHTARAHYSFAAEFDINKPMTVSGVITEVKWENPHMWIYLDVPDSGTGKVTTWGFEAGPPGTVMRMGVTPHSFKAGDHVTIHGFRAKDNRTFGQARDVEFADGRRFVIGAKGSDKDPQ